MRGCLELYVKYILLNYLWIEVIIPHSAQMAVSKWLKFGQRTVNQLPARHWVEIDSSLRLLGKHVSKFVCLHLAYTSCL